MFSFRKTPAVGEGLQPGLQTSSLGDQLSWLSGISENQAPVHCVTLGRPLTPTRPYFLLRHRKGRVVGASLTF